MASKSAFYFSDGPYLQILQGLHTALSAPEAFVKLLGPARSGKSSLCEKLSKYLKRKGYSVIYFRGAIESPDMLRSMLSRELDLPDSSNFPRLLEDALGEKSEKPLILLFDDAHLLTDITLLEIYRLAEVQIDSKRVLNIVLCGELPLEKRLLTNQEFKSLLLQVSHRFLLEPMDVEALGQFFYKYADYSGVPGLQLEQSAMNYFYKSCKGYPGPARDMCKLMVEARLGEGQLHPITRNELVNWFNAAASTQVLPTGQSQNSTRLGAIMPLAAVIAVASVGFLYQQLQPQDEASANQIAATNIPQTIRPQLTETATSPFSESSEAQEEISEETEPTIPAEEVPAGDLVTPDVIPEPVSDSSLALVTAQERGVNSDIIVEPQFEPMLATEDASSDVAAEVPAEVDPPLVEETATAEASSGRAEVPENADEQSPTEEPATLAAVEQSGEEIAQVSEIATTTDQAPGIVPEDPEPELSGDEEPSSNTDSEFATTETATEIAAEIATETTIAPTIETAEQQELASLALNSESATSLSSMLPEVSELEAAVAVWVRAWREKELGDYFASYHSGFIPRYQDTQAEWRSNRRRVIGNAEWIRLEMSDFKFIGVDAGMMEVHFWLSYESPTYSDNTQKKLLMVEEDGEWRIMEEINLQVRS